MKYKTPRQSLTMNTHTKLKTEYKTKSNKINAGKKTGHISQYYAYDINQQFLHLIEYFP